MYTENTPPNPEVNSNNRYKLSSYHLTNDRANVTEAIHKSTQEKVIIKRYYSSDGAQKVVAAAQALLHLGLFNCVTYHELENDSQPFWRERKNDASYTLSEFIPGSHETLSDFFHYLPSGTEPEVIQAIIESAFQVVESLEQLAEGIKVADNQVISYDHQDVGTHNLYLDENGVIILIDIEENHFALENQAVIFPPTNNSEHKREEMLKDIIIDIASNTFLSLDEKHQILAQWQEEIESDLTFQSLFKFYTESTESMSEELKQRSYQRKTSW